MFDLKAEDSWEKFEEWNDSLQDSFLSKGLLGHIFDKERPSETVSRAADGKVGLRKTTVADEVLYREDDVSTWYLMADNLDSTIKPTWQYDQTAYELYSWIVRAWDENLEVRYEAVLNSLLDLRLGQEDDCIEIYCDEFCRRLKHLKSVEQALAVNCEDGENARYCTGEGLLGVLLIRGTAQHKYLAGWRRKFARRDGQIQPLYSLLESLRNTALYFEDMSD